MVDIKILGCGITGMMTALAFANQGIKTSIVEKSKSEKFPLDVRTTTFNIAAKTILENSNIWQLIEDQAGILHEIYIVDNKSPRMLHLEAKKGNPRGFVIPNMFLKESLYQAVKSNPMIEIKKGVDYVMPYQKNEKVIINDEISADILLVCEGRNSVFKEAFPTKIDKIYGQSAIVLVAKHEKSHEGSAIEHFMPSGPFASLPMKDPNYSSIVWTESVDVANSYIKLPKNILEMHLQERMGEFLGKVQIMDDVQAFPLIARVVKKYYDGNIILVGDAAHSIHPLAGQGLNQGIKDIESIVSVFSKRLKLGLELDRLAFAEYEKARSLDNYSMYLITDNLNRIFSNNIFPLNILRKINLSIFNEIGWLKNRFSNYGSGIR